MMLNEGDVAPDFTVKTHTGETVALSKLRGKRVLLWFYPMADTPGCTAEGCSFRDLRPAYEGKNVVILGVSFDGVEANKKFADKFGFNFPLLCDTDKKIGLAYGAATDASQGTATRISYLIGTDGKIERAYGKVNAKEHPAAALAEL
jgi:thioredoxin-dependent peroxiredoxin